MTAAPVATPERVLVVKLADLGDALLTTPTVHALRAAWPDARLDVLTTPQAAVVFQASPDVDRVHTLDVHARGGAQRPRRAHRRQGADDRRAPRRAVRRDRALPLARDAPRRAEVRRAARADRRAGARGHRRPGRLRGWFLTRRGMDRGYDAAHVVETMAGVAAALGVAVIDLAPWFEPDAAARAAAAALWSELGAPTPSAARPLAGRTIAFHPGAGPYSPARRWAPDRFAAVAAAATTPAPALSCAARPPTTARSSAPPARRSTWTRRVA
ncbi:MAG: hypothetical protein U0470_12205 [Anaerolineae bacterium]